MTRPFRLEEDERRYFALRSEFLIRLVQSGVPAQTVHEVMRNFGKLEDMMFFEGMRQGMAATILGAVGPDHDDRSFIALHTEIYHNHSTPLIRVEEEWTKLFNDPETIKQHPLLDANPLEFAPITLTEAHEKYGPDLIVTGTPARQRAKPFDPATSPGMTDLMVSPESIPEYRPRSHQTPMERDVPLSKDDDAFDAENALERLANGEDPESIFAELAGVDLSAGALQDPVEVPPEADRPLERPALLDRIRDILLRLPEPPKNWQDMILMLMRETRHDASYLDEMLSAPMGMTVISQAKLFHLHPGAMPEVKPAERP